MGLGDPFNTTYEGSRQALGSYGQALQTTAGAFAERKKQQQEHMAKKTELLATLATKGIYPEGTGETFKLEGVGTFKKKKAFNFEELMDILGKNQGANNALGVTGATLDPETGEVKLNFGQTPASKVKEQSQIARAKEQEVAVGKAERLKTVGETVKQQWLKTSPYKGAITKSGMVPVLGQWDILKKGLGATSAQKQDQVYANFLQGIRAQLARGMGDVGNLSEYEQRAVIQLMPNLYDSYETGILKLGQLSQLVEDIKKTRGDNTNNLEDFSTMSDEELRKIARL